MKLLVDAGKAGADSKDEFGQTPLSLVAERGHEAVIRLLHTCSYLLDQFGLSRPKESSPFQYLLLINIYSP